MVVIVLIMIGYRFDWAGFNAYTGPQLKPNQQYRPEKTLWDWMQLLIIPAALAVGGYLFTFTTSRNERKTSERHNQTEREIAEDNQREAALQAYIDKMSELLLHEKLRESKPEDEVRKIARVRTLTVLPRLDGERKRSVLQFLRESGLIDTDKLIVDLREANLSMANLAFTTLTKADLTKADLGGAILKYANLTGASLNEASLMFADLEGANFTGADLTGANLLFTDLTKADLSKAQVTDEQLKTSNLLNGATMPDGSKHS